MWTRKEELIKFCTSPASASQNFKDTAARSASLLAAIGLAQGLDLFIAIETVTVQQKKIHTQCAFEHCRMRIQHFSTMHSQSVPTGRFICNWFAADKILTK